MGRKMKEVNTEQTVALFTLWGGEERMQRMTEGEKGSEMGGGSTHKQRILNGYLIPWESDHANPTLKGSERAKEKDVRRTSSARVLGRSEVN